MASSESRKILCPVCHRGDKVQRIQAAFDSGVQRLAPPAMPVQQISMMKYMFPAIVFVGLAVFFIILSLGNASTDWFQVVITLIVIVAALIVSFFAFQRVLRGDEESQKLMPAWDNAVARWKSLFYCRRDDVIFDPAKDKIISNEAFAALRSYEPTSSTPVTGETATAAH